MKCYKFIYSDRGSGKVLLEGIVTGHSKRDCMKKAHNVAMKKGLKPLLNDNKFYITMLK